MQYLLRNENRKDGDFYQRDSAAISCACKDINHEHFDPTFWAVMDGLNHEIHSVLDLASGRGNRLMQILNRYPGTTGLGIDIASRSLEDCRNRG